MSAIHFNSMVYVFLLAALLNYITRSIFKDARILWNKKNSNVEFTFTITFIKYISKSYVRYKAPILVYSLFIQSRTLWVKIQYNVNASTSVCKSLDVEMFKSLETTHLPIDLMSHHTHEWICGKVSVIFSFTDGF